MGQIFMATAYDIESKTCCIFYADKFHANCYSYSGAVLSMHYLQRKGPYRIIWGGDNLSKEDILNINSVEDLLGLSTYLDSEFFCDNINDIKNKNLYNKLKFNDENEKTWNRIKVEEEAIEYCYKYFGKNNDGLLLNDNNGTLYEGATLGPFGNRGILCNIFVKEENNEIYFKPQKSIDIDYEPDMDSLL